MDFRHVKDKVVKPRKNQSLAGLYVTRLATNTTERQIAAHVKAELVSQRKVDFLSKEVFTPPGTSRQMLNVKNRC